MKSTARVVWNGSLKDGKGSISTGSEVLQSVPYGFSSRFEGVKGTNPEELVAAAHASCFSMAFAAELGKYQITPEKIETSAVVVLEKSGDSFSVTESQLTTDIFAPNADESKIQSAGASAKENCPISKLLNAKITLNLQIKV